MTQARPALVFDLGGVLVDWDPRYLMERVITDPGRLEHFLTHVCPEEWADPVNRGEPFADALARRRAEFPAWAAEIEAYVTRWPEMVRGALPGTEELLRELDAAGAPLLALSNWPADTFWVARERFAVLEVFTEIVVSGFVGAMKPDPAIFDVLLDRSGRPAHECVLVDDRAGNVAAARDAGLGGILFRDAATLRTEPAIRAWLG